MKSNFHVCHVDQVLKLQKLGVLFNHTQFFYVHWSGGVELVWGSQSIAKIGAPSVMDLLNALPYFITVSKIKSGNVLTKEKYPDQFAVQSANEDEKEKYGISIADTPANALADMLIHCLESNLISADIVNKKINA